MMVPHFRQKSSCGDVATASRQSAGIGPAAEPAWIRIGWVVASSNWPAFLFAKQGIARHQGASYLMEDVHFSSTPQMITALASGDLDIGTLANSSFALAIENAKIEDLPVIADDFWEGGPATTATSTWC